MQREFKIGNNQWLGDIALMEFNDVQRAVDIAIACNVSVTADVQHQELEFDLEGAAKYVFNKPIANAELLPIGGGIGYEVIAVDFYVHL